MTIGYYLLMFVLGLALLVWGSNLFVDSAITLANRFHLSEVLIGATIVSLGTTLPEMLFSTMASVQGLSEMALGNALGSILCNTGLIAGMLLVLRPVVLKQKELGNIKTGVFFLSAGFLVYVISGVFLGGLVRLSGIVLLFLCASFIKNTVQNAAGQQLENGQQANLEDASFGMSDAIRIVLEAGAIYTGAEILVKYGPELAREFGIPEIVISLTFVALGTSLPELVTSLIALKKDHGALSLGNIIGANILNFVLVGGLSAVIHPIVYPDHILSLELPFVFLLLFLLCIPSLYSKRAGRVQGTVMMGSYILYLMLMGK